VLYGRGWSVVGSFYDLIGVILSERSESKDPYSSEKSEYGRLAQHKSEIVFRP